MRIILLVFINLMFVFVVGFHSLAAMKLWNSDRAAAFAGALGALQFLSIWMIAGVAWLVGHGIRDYLWWLVVALAGSTVLRLWATVRYRPLSRSAAPDPARSSTT